MAEKLKRGVVIEFDFAVLDGADLLFATAQNLLASLEIPFDNVVEAQHLAGGNYQGGLAEYFGLIKTKKTPQKAAKDLSDAFVQALTQAVPAAVTPAFKAFVTALTEKGVKVVITTRADLEQVTPAFADILGENVALYQETSQCYGSVKWDAWRRALAMNKLRNYLSVGISGSGYGVKSALLAGMGAIGVVKAHTAYQDFGGADEVVQTVDPSLAATVCRILRIA